MDKVSVSIAMPLYSHVSPIAMINFVGVLQACWRGGIIGGVSFTRGAFVDAARNGLVIDALNKNPTITHIMWIDSDMVLPTDAVLRLLEDDKPIVGGLYHHRVDPFDPVAYHLNPFRVLEKLPTSIERVGGLGFGCTLVRAEIYPAMARRFNDVKWHECKYPDGEDVHFFDRCAEMGIETWLDPLVKCGHIMDEVITSERWKPQVD